MKSKGLFGRDINESHVPCVRFLDRYLCGHVLFRKYERCITAVLRSNCIFCVLIVSQLDRADVHLYFRCLLDNLFCRIYILFCVHYGSRTGRPLKKDDPDGSSFFMFYKVNPLMNGFCSCSVAMSVSGPCPLNTSVSSGSVSSF